MGNTCAVKQEISNEEKAEIQNEEQSHKTRAVKIPVFTKKLGLNFKLDEGIQKIRPKHDNESVQDISTERNLQDSNAPHFFVQYKQNEDSCKGYWKQKHTEDFLKEICSKEVVSEKAVIQKKEDEYDDYYDQIRENDLDQFKFQTIFIMKLVDRNQSQFQRK
ncbi:unnamed protein product (macronuclear) [Paramecium tetraurelia]|uniref:Uncharacterized protein n=1 Tax=Paramecium tetraurelia TaxID=5888 RepID=A0BVB2_PARTE|nr:uncharacterized protein GSPATT00005725001 [Paramecium tetraurelia]CAK62479.1 unnamed protein product [Paramecium tetraurelia]|eukprot:XP_001429877.1 hypothetical protein (macronuclear) [Paramecium tetraurelia strain d4-2]